jgi:hypothetical protein
LPVDVTFVVEQLVIDSGGTLDSMTTTYRTYTGASQLARMQALINSGRNGGTWSGPGITSSSARNNPQHNTTLGAMEATDYKSIYGASATFTAKPSTTPPCS